MLLNDLFEQGGEPGEGLIAGVVAIGVVDLLERIEVDDQQREREILPAVPAHLVLEIAEEETTILDAGEFVLEDEAGWVFPDVLEEIYEVTVGHSAVPWVAAESVIAGGQARGVVLNDRTRGVSAA